MSASAPLCAISTLVSNYIGLPHIWKLFCDILRSFRLSHQDEIASHKSAQRILNLCLLFLHVEKRRQRERNRQRNRGRNSWENQMAVLWYLLSWRGQKVRMQPETERQYRLRGPHPCGLGYFKSTAGSECSNKQMHAHIQYSAYTDTWMHPQEL